MESLDSKFKIGDPVVVASENRKGNPRTPKYIRGKRGHSDPLYTVRFDQNEVSICHDTNPIWVDVHGVIRSGL